MKIRGSGVVGQAPGSEWVEVTVPYKANRNEENVEYGDEYTDRPCWAIWDWLEANVPDLHRTDGKDNDNGPVSWMRLHRIDTFAFYFEEKETAMLFKLTFGGM